MSYSTEELSRLLDHLADLVDAAGTFGHDEYGWSPGEIEDAGSDADRARDYAAGMRRGLVTLTANEGLIELCDGEV